MKLTFSLRAFVISKDGGDPRTRCPHLKQYLTLLFSRLFGAT